MGDGEGGPGVDREEDVVPISTISRHSTPRSTGSSAKNRSCRLLVSSRGVVLVTVNVGPDAYVVVVLVDVTFSIVVVIFVILRPGAA